MTVDTLTLDSVRVERGGRTVVDGVTASLGAGQVVALCGSNGAGKSSLLAAIAGALPFEGSIMWRGKRPAIRELAYMPQSKMVQANMTALEVVLLGRIEELRWHLGSGELSAAAAALEAVGLGHLAERRIDTLSGGQQQLVLLAQRLARRPQLLLLDEPTSALDLSRQLLVLDMLTVYARKAGALVLVVLHDLSLAARFASRLLLLHEGALVGAGPPSELLRPEVIRAAYSIEAEILYASSGHRVIAPLRPCITSGPASA